ncbi:unnamed protein product [Colias eurytheme]|nr:unnamed protein product [Colias eurytheme]
MAGQLCRFIYLKYFTILILFVSVNGSWIPIDESKLSPECRTLGICTEVPDYPEDIANELIKELRHNQTIFSNDITLSTLSIESRFSFTPLEVELCDSMEKLYVPKAAKSKSGLWFYILNTKQEPVQRFRVEICRPNDKKSMMRGNTENGRCSLLALFSNDSEGICVQKYILREMIALSRSKREAFVEHFYMPCCCECVERKK